MGTTTLGVHTSLAEGFRALMYLYMETALHCPQQASRHAALV